MEDIQPAADVDLGPECLIGYLLLVLFGFLIPHYMFSYSST